MASPEKRFVSVVQASSVTHMNDEKPGTSSSDDSLINNLLCGEDKQMYIYKKLVVPMNMRSACWKYYGFPANEDGEILTKVKIVCIICKSILAYNGNTSNLRLHLRSKHPQELDDLEANSQTIRKQSTVKKKKIPKPEPVSYIYSGDNSVHLEKDVRIVSDPDISLEELTPEGVKVVMKTLPADQSNNVTFLMEGEHSIEATELGLPDQSDQSLFEKNSISEAITQFIISDLQLPEVVETPGFQRVVATLRSPCEIPSKYTLVDEIIPKLYDSYGLAVLDCLNDAVSNITLSIEEWQSENNQVYVTISAHFQHKLLEDQQNKVLSTIYCSELYNVQHWSKVILQLLSDWHINRDKVKIIVISTTIKELLNALKLNNFIMIPCLLFTLQDVCQNGCFNHPVVSKVINKIRTLLALIYQTPNVLASLHLNERELQLEEAPLIMDYKKIWISTYVMLEQLLARRTILKGVTDSIESEFVRELVEVHDEEWTIIEDIVTVLEPFKVTIMTVAEEKSPLVSLVKPLLWQLKNVHLKTRDESDSDLAKELKKKMLELLQKTYSEEAVDTTLNIATTLDPRFKSFPYATEESKAMLQGPIKSQLTEVIEESNTHSKADSGSSGTNQQLTKKPRLSGMELLLGNIYSASNSISTNERADLEINQYSSELTANLDHCPLKWWQSSASKFVNLAKVASRYSCIPASAISTIRIPVDAQVAFDMKRSKVLPELVDKLIFLNANHLSYY